MTKYYENGLGIKNNINRYWKIPENQFSQSVQIGKNMNTFKLLKYI